MMYSSNWLYRLPNFFAPVTLSIVSARARLRNVGVEVIRPNEASAMPPDLTKYLLFIGLYLLSKTNRLDARLVPPTNPEADKSAV